MTTSAHKQTSAIYWFRNDLRLHDQPGLKVAIESGADKVIPVYCHPDPEQQSLWGFSRQSHHRQYWTRSALAGLDLSLRDRGSALLQFQGEPSVVLPILAKAIRTSLIVCEEIAVPYEQAQVQALRNQGLTVHTVWQSSMIDPDQLPWPAQKLPGSFTPFRQTVESGGITESRPISTPNWLPECPSLESIQHALGHELAILKPSPEKVPGDVDPRSSFPYTRADFDGSESAGLAHLARYLNALRAHSYKKTRNDLTGIDYSSKWSPWLATGALSAREIMAQLRAFESTSCANEGSYWLWFELLWRDFFRFLHLQQGTRLYREQGLSTNRNNSQRDFSHCGNHNEEGFWRWSRSATGEPLIDAAMRELHLTGFLSNRLRQIVASYLVHELGGDWRAGAAWFESQLIDYDPYSNQGNWLYIAGRGTDPRGGRHFNVKKQARQYDPENVYQHLWSQD